MGRTEDLLLLESAGQLPPEMQKDLDTLRAAGIIPQKGGGADTPPTSAPVSATPEPQMSMTRKAVDYITKPVEPRGVLETYGTSIGDAVSGMFAPKESGTFPGAQINEALAAAGYPNLGAGIATATELPGMAVRGAAGLMNTAGAIMGIPAAGRLLNEGVQNVGMWVGLPERVAGTMGTAANVGTNLLLPGKITSGLQSAAQKILPHFSSAAGAMLEKQVANFRSLLNTKIGTAEQKLAAQNSAFEALDPSVTIPLKETVSTLKQILIQESPKRTAVPNPLAATLERQLQIIESNGGGLTPQMLDRAMTDIGTSVGSIKATLGQDTNALAAKVFAVLAKDASTPAMRVQSVTPRATGPVLALPAPGQTVPVAGGKFEAGPMSRTIQQKPTKTQLALPPPGEPTAVAWGGNFESGKIPMTKQVQSPGTERGKFIYDDKGNLRPDAYMAPTSGEIPYSGVTVMKEGSRPISAPSALGRKQVALDTEGQLPFRDPRTGQLIAKELKEPWKPGEPVRSFKTVESSARPVPGQSFMGRQQRILGEKEQAAFRDPQTGELVAPGTRVQFADTSGQVVLDRKAAFREKKSLDDIGVIFDKLLKAKRGMDSEFRDFNAAQMINHLAQRPKLVEGVPAPDMADLEKILARIAELPNLPPPKGVMFGSGKIAETGMMIGGATMGLGGSAQTAARLGAIVTGFQAASRALLPTAIGRKAILAVLDSGPINQTKVNMLAALAASVRPAEMVQSDIREMLKTPEASLEEKMSALQALR